MIGAAADASSARASADLQALALRIAFGASIGDRAEREALDQLVGRALELGAVQSVQLAVVANVFAAGEMRIQAARVRQHAERATHLQRLLSRSRGRRRGRGLRSARSTVLRMRSVVDLPAPL